MKNNNIFLLEEKLNLKTKITFLPLSSIVFFDRRFNHVASSKQPKILNFVHVTAKQLKSFHTGGEIKLLATGQFDGFTKKNSENQNLINQGEVIALPSGGVAHLKYYHGSFIDSGNILFSSRDPHQYSLKFIYYYLQSRIKVIQSYFRGAGIQHPEMSKIIDFPIPIPPITLQRYLVQILDQFETYSHDLIKGLPAEINARQKQYQYYRDQLLKFE